MTRKWGGGLMEVSDEYARFKSEVRPALRSKQEEFFLLGYDNVSEEDIWEFLKKKNWRKATEPIMLYEMVQHILSLKIGDYMHHASIEALKEADFSGINEDDMLELLK
jgi:hypothetical protein